MCLRPHPIAPNKTHTYELCVMKFISACRSDQSKVNSDTPIYEAVNPAFSMMALNFVTGS